MQVSTLTESRGPQVKSDSWKHWPTHWAWQAQGAEQERLSLTGQCDLPPRTASPERIGESSGSSGSDCAAPGGESSGSSGSDCAAPGRMVKRTGRCVSLSLRDGVRAVLRFDIVTHTPFPFPPLPLSLHATWRGPFRLQVGLESHCDNYSFFLLMKYTSYFFTAVVCACGLGECALCVCGLGWVCVAWALCGWVSWVGLCGSGFLYGLGWVWVGDNHNTNCNLSLKF